MSTNKKNFIISFACNCTTLILLIEHLCGVNLALECMHIWVGISTIVHIAILRDYLPVIFRRNKKK
jgi:hypothetical protein